MAMVESGDAYTKVNMKEDNEVISPEIPLVNNGPKRFTLANLRVNVDRIALPSAKRVADTSVSNVTPSKRRKTSKSADNSPTELNAFVVQTPKKDGPELDGGYQPEVLSPETEGIADSVKSRRRRSSKPAVSPVTPKVAKPPPRRAVSEMKNPLLRRSRRNSVILTEDFTQVETATGSGRKVMFRWGVKKNLKSKDISNILDSDDDVQVENEGTASKVEAIKGITKIAGGGDTPIRRSRRLSETSEQKPTPTLRTRRASSSTVTPKKERSVPTRSVSEIKSSRRPRMSYAETSDDDFLPQKPAKKGAENSVKKAKQVKKSTTGAKKAVKKGLESESESSDSSSEEEAPKRGRSKSAPTTPRANKRVFKPGVAPRAAPVPTDLQPIAAAQQRLHVSAVPDSLPCREEQFAEILGFVESRLKEDTGGCMYISGVPGTGKTATVKEVMRYLRDDGMNDLPEFDFHEINGMRLTSPEQAYTEMWRLLTGQKATPEHAMQLLDRRFSTPAPRRQPTVFLVDELDMLWNRKQSVLYNMFSWPSRQEGKLIILAIANTMDLPERVFVNRVMSRVGLTRQIFQPYTHQQLQQIVASRLEGLEVFRADAIQLVARKVASLSGDARRALDICRRATELAESEGATQIGLQHMTQAHQEMFTSPKILAIRSCTKYEQMLLKVMVAEFHRTGVEETSVGAVFREHQICLRTEGLEIISMVGTVAMIARLSALRLVLAEHFKLGLMTKLRLNVATDDIEFALKKIEE